jgi:hypothetical protein
VAAAAGLSRSWIYRDADINAEIRRLRQRSTSGRTPTMPANQRATDHSLHARIATLLDTNQDLRNDNQKLRHQLAVLLGEKRRGPVSDMSPTQTPRSA